MKIASSLNVRKGAKRQILVGKRDGGLWLRMVGNGGKGAFFLMYIGWF